jgi:aspartate kinase
MTPRAKDSLVSFGERLSTTIFAAYLRRLAVPAVQVDAWKLGIVTSDEFTNAEIDLGASMPAVLEAVTELCSEEEGRVLVVTGFIGRGKGTGELSYDEWVSSAELDM